MKKFSLIVFLLTVSLLTCFATAKVEFDWITHKTMFKESPADPFSFISSAQFIYIKEDEMAKYPLRFSYIENNNICYANAYPDPDINGSHNAIKFKFAINESVFKTKIEPENLPSVEFDVAAKAYTVFGFARKTYWKNMIGFDGSWLLGPEVRIAGKYTIKGAFHHLSCHYGDEFLTSFNLVNKVDLANHIIETEDGTYAIQGMSEYVRNCWLLGFQAELNHGFSTYAEVDIPLSAKNNFPFYQAYAKDPDFYLVLIEKECNLTPDGELLDNLMEEREKFTDSPFYRAVKIHAGVQWNGKLGPIDTYAALDVQAYQDNMTCHQIGGFSKDNAWDFDYTAVAGIGLPNFAGNHGLNLEIAYHWGRMLFHNYYYLRGNQFYFGISLR